MTDSTHIVHLDRLAAAQSELLRRLAAKYIWWKTPSEALRQPQRVIAQVMTLGDYDDVQAMVAALGYDALRAVVRDAEPGWFDARSWTYWHYRLHLAAPDQVPPLPARRFS